MPKGFQSNRLPAGITLIAPAFQEARLAGIGHAFHRATGLSLGATEAQLPPDPPRAVPSGFPTIDIAVFGAHMQGLPLNGELMALGGSLVGPCRTAPVYKFYRLMNAGPARPGLVRVSDGGGAVVGEVWRLPGSSIGALLASIPMPLGLGDVHLEGGATVKGFLCEAAAIAGAEDISALGDWRRYLART